MAVTKTLTVLQAAANFDLTTLAIVKDELNIDATDTSNDSWLSRAISQSSLAISNYCNRQFLPQLYSETQQIQQDPYPYQTPGGVAPLQLAYWPLLQVQSVVQIYPIGQNNPLTVNVDYSVDLNKGWLTRLNPFTDVAVTWESLPTVIIYSAGYGVQVSEQQTIPATPGPYTVTATNAATFAFDDGVTYKTSGTAFTRITGSPASAGQYAVVPATGVYTFDSADQAQTVLLDYAYSNIPLDIVDVILRLVTQRFKQKDRDPLLMSIDQPGVGVKRWWIPSASGNQSGAFPPEIANMLDPYRVPVIA